MRFKFEGVSQYTRRHFHGPPPRKPAKDAGFLFRLSHYSPIGLDLVAIQFNKNATFDLHLVGRVSNFIAYSFPGCQA